jgi:hypothetical protein
MDRVMMLVSASDRRFATTRRRLNHFHVAIRTQTNRPFLPGIGPRTRSTPPVDPVAELNGMLDRLRATEVMPGPTISGAMQEEYRALWLAKQAGPAAAEFAALVTDEFERLMALTD